jgi:hypothetical protein
MPGGGRAKGLTTAGGAGAAPRARPGSDVDRAEPDEE